MGLNSKRRRITRDRLAALLVAVLVAAATLGIAVAHAAGVDDPYDASGNGPVEHTLCPLAFPSGGWSPAAPTTFQVQKWAFYAGAEIPFFARATSLNGALPPVMPGFGWYRPEPVRTTYLGTAYTWQSDAPAQGPGVLVECFRRQMLWGMAFSQWATYTGQTWGHAFPDELNPNTYTRPKLGSENDGSETIGAAGDCWELVAVWWDEAGYHETVLDAWCEESNAT